MWWDEKDEIVNIVRFIQNNENTQFQGSESSSLGPYKNLISLGLYTHCGNTYKSDSIEEVNRLRDITMDYINILKDLLKKEGLECPTWGIGSTPSCSHDTKQVPQQNHN